MRKLSFRATALIVSLLLTFGPAASASWAMGSKTHQGTTHLAEGVDYTRQYLWSATYSDLRTEHYMEYTPNDLVSPVVSYGDSVTSKTTLSAMAAGLEAGGSRVIGGINGDYFVLSTGAPLGIVITDGILRSSSSSHFALGFDDGGNLFIGKPELSITATLNGHTLSVSGGLNKVRSEQGGYVLYTRDFAATTRHTSPGVDVILSPGTDEQSAGELEQLLPGNSPSANPPQSIQDTLVYTDVPVVGGRLSCTVEQVLHSTGSIGIPEGKLVLSIHGKGNEWLVSQLTSLKAGDTVDIDITSPDKRWESARSAVGALYKLVTNGQAESGLDAGQGPRSAVGIRADGSAVFYTVDGRQSGYSVGASMEQVARRLVELGCVEAVCMDGGGSTTLGATLPGQGEFSVLSSPSDGSQRTISNALFLVAEKAETGPARQLSLSPGDAIVFPGARVKLSALSTDRLGQAVKRYTNNQVTYTIPAEGGTVSNGILTAGTQAGSYTLEASADGLTGHSQITVIPTPDRISLRMGDSDATLTALNAAPGDSFRLVVDAVYRNLPMACQNEDFTWTISDNIGTIDRFGNYTAGDKPGTGTITVSAGDYSLSIPVTVSRYIRTLKDFEGGFSDLTGSTAAQIEPEGRSSYVRYGRQSARLTYDAAGSPFAAFGLSMELTGTDRCLHLWVYGDGSGNTLSAPVVLADGTSVEQTLTLLDFTGWRQISVALPAGCARILSLKIIPTGTIPTGTIWLDQVTVSTPLLTDQTAPGVFLTLLDTTLHATLSDNVDTSFPESRVTVTCDGIPLPFTVEGASLSAQLPEWDGLAHRVSVTVTDSSGNLRRASIHVSATEQREPPFADTVGHWASDAVTYLSDRGVITGVADADRFLFLPGNSMTRGEFAVMVSRWLGLDLTQYESVTLPFVDADRIPSWMLSAVKAMYQLGYMQGSTGSDGLYALHGNGITRAEAITLLSRTQPRGYAAAELTFDDTDEIPVWAQEAVSTLVAQGAISGSNNRFHPNNTITRAEMAKILSVLW